jgi:hypothetical protein
MTPKEYLETIYKKDLERFGNSEICGMTMSIFYKKEERDKWQYLDHFLIVQYELNLLDQVIYSNFRQDHEMWKSNTLPFADCRCASCHGGVHHPLSILWVAERELSRRGEKFFISRELILEYDKYFLEYVKTTCAKNSFLLLTSESLMTAIKNDPDCNDEKVLRYFSKK